LLDALETERYPQPEVHPIRSPEHVFNDLADWIGHFMTALGRAVGSRDGEPDLSAAVDDLVSVRQRLQGSLRLRPWVLIWRRIDDLVHRVEEVATSFLRAIDASTPIEGQRWASDGQTALDAAAEEAADLARRLDAFAEREELLEQGGLPALISEMSGPMQGNDLELDASGRALYERLTGEPDCPAGLGGGLRLTGLQAELLMDPDHFWDITAEYTQLLTGRRDRLAMLTKDTEWRSDMRDASRRMQDAGLAHEVLMGSARHDRHRVQAALTLLHSLAEGPIRRYAATLLAVARGLPYKRQRHDDLGALMQRLRQAGVASVPEGVDIALRGAKAHEEYEVTDEGGLSLRRGGSTTEVPSDELLDRFLACLEVSLALSTAIIVAAVSIGAIETELLSELVPLELSAEEGVALAMSFVGWSEVAVVPSGAEVSVSGRTSEVHARQVTQLLPYLDDSVTGVRLVGRTASGERTITAPLDPWRRWREASDEEDKMIVFVEAMAGARLDGEPSFGREVVRKWAAGFVVHVDNSGSDLRSRIARLRELRAMADRIGDPDLARAVAGVISVVQAKETGLPAPRTALNAIDLITRWGTADVSFPT
jgi:hypothetical protein